MRRSILWRAALGLGAALAVLIAANLLTLPFDRRETILFVVEVVVEVILLGAVFLLLRREQRARVVAQASTAETEDRYRGVVAALQEGIIIRRADRKVLACNTSAERILGLSAAQILGEEPRPKGWHTTHPDGTPFRRQDDLPSDTTIRTGEVGEPQVVGVHHPDGRFTWITTTTRPLSFDKGGRPSVVVTSFADITARHEAEARLQEARATLAGILEQLPSGVTVFNAQGGAVLVNEAARRLAAVTSNPQGQLESRTPLYRTRDAEGRDIPLDQTPSARALRGEASTNVEVSFVRPGSQEDTWARVSARPLLAADGKVQGAITVFTDITRERQATAAARDRAAIVEASDDAIYGFTLDERQILTSWNRGAELIYGYTPQEALGQPRSITVPPDRWDEMPDLVDRLVRGESIRIESVRLKKDGTRFDAAITYSPIRDEDGRPVGVAAIARDVTERNAARTELERTAADLAEAQRTASIGSWEWDIESDVTTRSDEMYRIYGLRRGTEEDTNQRFIEAIHPEDRSIVRQATVGAFESPGPFSFEHRIVRPAGEVRHLLARGRVLVDEAGKPIRMVATSQDITDQKEADAQLRQREADLVQAQEIANIGSWTWDVPSRQGRGSAQFFRIFGLDNTSPDFFAPEWRERVIPEDRDRVDKTFAQAVREQRPIDTEYRVELPGGEQRIVHVRGTVEVGPDGRTHTLRGTVQDITATRLAEEQLRRRELQLSQAQQVANTGHWEWVAATREFSWSDQLYRIFGLKPGEGPASYERLLEFIHPEDRDEVTDLLQRALDRLRPFNHEHRVIRADGETRFVQARGGVVFDAENRPSGLNAILRDVTEPREQAAALEESERRFESLVQALEVIVWEADAQTGRYSFVSDQARLLLGYPLAAWLEDPGFWQAHIHPEDREAAAAYRANSIANRQSHEFEYRMLAQDGREVWLRDYAVVESREGEQVRLRGVMVDITEAKKMEEAILQTQKMESLGVLAGGIAHDFNNLLVGILVNAGLAIEDLEEDSPARDAVLRIETAVQRAADLAEQVLAYSGKGQLVVGPLDLNGLVAEVHSLVGASIPAGVEVQTEMEEDLPAVEGDGTQLRQVVMNLVINAADAIGAGPGNIRVVTRSFDASRAELEADFPGQGLSEGRYACLQVTDTGSGMDAETRARIFDPFFTTKVTGRGLGLASVMGIVRSHRGAIAVDSEPGKGTTFRVLLPALDAPAPRIEVARDGAGTFTGAGTALVVDDHPGIREVATHALRRLGFDVIAASDGREGLAAFRSRCSDISCVLLDMTMPGMRGDEAFRAIREVDPTARIVVMSGYNPGAGTEWVNNDERAAFIRKPFTLAALREALERTLRN